MGDRRRRLERALWILSLGLLVAVSLSRASRPASRVAASVNAKTPVIFVPGVTGVRLRDVATGKLVWGTGASLLAPHDRGHGTARSLTDRHRGPQIVPAGAILRLRLFGLVRYEIYQQLVDFFSRHDYRFGDLEKPRDDDELFLFSYDWRQDNVVSAARLAAQLEELRATRGASAQRVHLICQSNGAHICRYFTKYGGLKLHEAESGRRPSTGGTIVETLTLVGASNGGSIRVLREMNRGRRYLGVIGRQWSPETLFTFRSLYQDLPVYREDLFVDESGASMAIDLFDAGSWERFQWSIHGARTRGRIERASLPVWFGTASERRAFLVDALDRARRFHRLLRKDVDSFGETRYSLITNSGRETSSRAVMIRQADRWQTLFGDDERVRDDPVLRSSVIAPGDGHATAASQEWLSPQETERLGVNTLEVEGSHRRVILQEAALEWILRSLKRDEREGPPGSASSPPSAHVE